MKTDPAPIPDVQLNHGAIGNGQVLALVSPDTRIEWLCLPRFDGPSVFGCLLDRERGGSWGFEPAAGPLQSRMEYVRNTNVLRSRLETPDGVCDLFDYAPRVPTGLSVDAPLEIHRLVLPVSGNPTLRVRFDPRPDYARARVELVPVDGGLEIYGGAQRLFLRTNLPTTYILNGKPVRVDHGRFLVFSCGQPSELSSVPATQHVMEMTVRGWRAWAKTCALPSFAPEAVLRSALCLKLHTFLDTGAVIAAATTSIPEALGTERTWDYRYCWLRDAAFTVEALRRLSHLAEGEAFVRFLRDVAEAGPLQPVYGIGGERDLPEEQLTHLSGFGGTRPVRIGNSACIQTQHDVMGEMILCLETVLTDPRIVVDQPEGLLPLVERLVEAAMQASRTEDTGIWEFRTLPKFYTFSQVQCWVAAHRGAEFARAFGRPDLAERWLAWAGPFRERILREAYSEELGYFTQSLRGRNPDASNLLLPTLGFVDAKDPRFVSTVRAYERLLVKDNLMFRYRHPDDFGETTTAFSICSFWWVEALAMMGELDRAVEVFQRLLSHANPLGLFSEDIEPETGRLLGNFPQAYTHVGLIHAAITIGGLLDARATKFRAWS
jgi:GH15 family glucan-1,4-alpha-glucosidase